jgi:hypothetical protein
MKLKHIFLGLVITGVGLAGCDEISQPLIVKQTNSSLPSTPPTFRDSSTNYNVYKVLLDDCMGHLCPNCPSAVHTGDGLIAPANPLSSQIVLMEDNIGGFAVAGPVAGTPDSAFRKDYTSVVGNIWGTILFNATTVGFPFGMINRRGYTNASQTVADELYPNWQDTIQSLLLANPTPQVTINIHDSCWVPQRIIGVEFQVTFKTAFPTGSYLLETLIIQDSIIDWQKDNGSSSQFDTNFVHRNVLRGAFGNNTGGLTAGVAIPTSVSSVSGGTWTSYQTYDFVRGENGKAGGIGINPPWNMAHCYIVAFVYNSPNNASPYQVVQAEMIKVE